MKLELILKLLLWSVFTVLFCALETALAEAFNSPTFYGEASGSAVLMLTLLALYLKFTLWFLKGPNNADPNIPAEKE